MSDQQDTVGLILAYKNPMSIYGTITAVRRLTLAIRKAGIDPIIIVTGKQSYEVEHSMSDFGLIFIKGEESNASTELDYIRCGLTLAKKIYKKALIVSTEFPLVLPQTIHDVLQCSDNIVVTRKGNNITYPVKVEENEMSYLFHSKQEKEIKEYVSKIKEKLFYHDTIDLGVIEHKKDSNVLANLVEKHNQALLQTYVISFMETEKPFFDKRILLLLKLIHEFSSVKTACKHMAMSYAKAWDALNYLESMLGYQVVNRSHGGKRGGNTTVTTKGMRFIHLYEEYEKRVKEYSRNCFSELFPEFWENETRNEVDN